MQEFKNNKKEYGVFFNGHHSTDFGIDALVGKEVGFPTKKKILVQPPFSNTIYDFSNVYNGQMFEERTYKQVFNVLDYQRRTQESMYRMWTRVVNWLMSAPTKQPLYDDVMKRYYYLAEVVKEPSLQEFLTRGELTVEWTCYPFRIYELQEGNDIWDTFDFELDIAQHTKFEVNGAKEIVLYNIGLNTNRPSIKASSQLTINQNGTQFIIPAGTSSSSRFRLVAGENRFTVTGNGTIEFVWHKELI